MELQIKYIEIGNGDRIKKKYNIKQNKINIINGKSGTGKTPFMSLLFYATGNSEGKNYYFNQYVHNTEMSDWLNEYMVVRYNISHNSQEYNFEVRLDIDIEQEEIFTSLWINNNFVFAKEPGSTALKNKLIDVLEIPSKVFWKNTVIKRNFSEFHSFFATMINGQNYNGNFYDIAGTRKAPSNSFISAYAFLNNNKKALKILRKAENFKNIESITRKNLMLSDFLSSFEEVDLQTQSSKMNSRAEALLQDLTSLITMKKDLKSLNATLKASDTRIKNKNKKLIQIIENYNEKYNQNINTNELANFLNVSDGVTINNKGMIYNQIHDNNYAIEQLDERINKIKDSIQTNYEISEFGLENIIKEKVKKIIDNNKESLNNGFLNQSQDPDSDSDDEGFMELFSEWRNVYFEMYKELTNHIKNKFPNEFKISEKIKKIKAGPGGLHFFRYIKLFLGLYTSVSNDNEFPMLIDSLYDINTEIAPDHKTKVQIFDILKKDCKHGAIITMTTEDYEEIKSLTQDCEIFDAPGS